VTTARTGLVTAMLPPDVGGTQVVIWRLFKDDPGVVVVSGAGSVSPPEGPYRPLDAPTLRLPYPHLRGYRYGLGPLWAAYGVAWLAYAARRAARFFAHHQVDRIVSVPHHGPFALLGLLVARRLELPHTFYILDSWEEAAMGSLDRKLIQQGLRVAARTPHSTLAAVSPALMAHYRRTYGFQDCVWIPNPGPLPEERSAPGTKPEPIVVLSGGIKSFNYDAILAVIEAMRGCTVARKLIITGPGFRFGETLRSWGAGYDHVECLMGTREEVAAIQRRAAVLLIATNVADSSLTARGYLPGRLPEYVAAGRPILLIGPATSDAWRAINHWRLGRTLASQDKAAIAEAIDDLARESIESDGRRESGDFDALFLEVFSREEARRRLLGGSELPTPPSARAASLAGDFEQPFRKP